MPTRTRARASFPVFGSHVAATLSTVTRCDTCQTNSEIFATPCTRRYLRPPGAERRGVAVSAGNAPRQPMHNEGMRITNATVRYRVSGRIITSVERMIRNYAQSDGSGRLRWRCIFFHSYKGEIIVRNCLHGAEPRETPRSGTKSFRCPSGFSCLSHTVAFSFRIFVLRYSREMCVGRCFKV